MERKNRLTYWHQVLTLVGVPIILAAIYWMASQAVEIRDNSRQHTDTLSRIESSIPQQWKMLNDHEARIRIIEAQRGPERPR